MMCRCVVGSVVAVVIVVIVVDPTASPRTSRAQRRSKADSPGHAGSQGRVDDAAVRGLVGAAMTGAWEIVPSLNRLSFPLARQHSIPQRSIRSQLLWSAIRNFEDNRSRQGQR